MFKNTNEFIEKIIHEGVARIDIKNYIAKITDYKVEKLESLLYDIEFNIFIYEDELIGQVTNELLEQKLKYYEKKGQEPPIIEHENHLKKHAPKHGKNLENETDKYFSYDYEKMFYPYELFTIRLVRNYVTKLINENTTTQKTFLKHDNIFSNNGFILFDYILNNYVKPKEKRGRETDLIFFYWKMNFESTQYIHVKPTVFFKWFDKNYDNIFGQLKTLQQTETPQRIKDYSTALDWFKTQNK
jgi:hypothetical protein